jgi:hypothetical protein
MSGITMCMAMMLLGIDASWQPLPQGGMDYTIRIEPEALDLLRSGQQMVESDVPPEVRDVRVIHVLVAAAKPTADPHDKTTDNATMRSTSRPPLAAGTGTGTWPPPRPSDDRYPALVPPSTTPTSPTAAESKPLAEQRAAAAMPSVEPAKGETKPPSVEPTKADEPAKPWLPFSLVCLGLFASLGGNVFLGWLYKDVRSRYHALLARAA